MPLKVNVGLSQKIGQPDFGSLGASCHVELELESSLLQHDPGAFQQHVRHAYLACRQAVQDQLAQDRPPPASNGRPEQANGTRVNHGNGNGSAHDNGNRGANGSRRRPPARPATASQVRALHAVANRQGLDLGAEVQRFHAARPEDLSITEASRLIDEARTSTDSPPRRSAKRFFPVVAVGGRNIVTIVAGCMIADCLTVAFLTIQNIGLNGMVDSLHQSIRRLACQDQSGRSGESAGAFSAKISRMFRNSESPCNTPKAAS